MPQEPSADDSDVIKILLKLPSGTRLERRFLKSQSLKVGYRKKSQMSIFFFFFFFAELNTFRGSLKILSKVYVCLFEFVHKKLKTDFI